MNIYVGNLAYSSTEEEIRELFEEFGTVESVKLINDRETGRPKGFGFIEMEDEAGRKAVEELDGKEYQSRQLRVSEARERTPRRQNFQRRF